MTATATATATASTETSSKRAEANRRNAARSTGPRTQVGKQRSRFNALKHGLRAKTPVLPSEDAAALQARRQAWSVSLDPRDDVERYLVDRAVTISWQLDRVDRAQAARLDNLRLADAGRIDGEAETVAILGRRLFWDPVGPLSTYPHDEIRFGNSCRISWSGQVDDPNDPARVVAQLEGLTLGCAWMLDRWGELRSVLEKGLNWQSPDRFRAIRLLGKQPMDCLSDERVVSVYLACWAMDPDVERPFLDTERELTTNGDRDRHADRLVGSRDVTEWAPEDPEAGLSALLELIDEEEGRLEELLTQHLEREDAFANGRLGFDDTDEGERLRRHQVTMNRTLLRIIETLRQRRRKEQGASRTAGASAPGEPAGCSPTVAAGPEPSANFDDYIGRGDDAVELFPISPAEIVTNEPNGPVPAGSELPFPTEAVPASSAERLFRERGSREGEAPSEPAPPPCAARTEPRPPCSGTDREATTPEIVTNEANGPIETAHRSVLNLPSALLNLLALLFFAGFTAAVAFSPRLSHSHDGYRVLAVPRSSDDHRTAVGDRGTDRSTAPGIAPLSDPARSG